MIKLKTEKDIEKMRLSAEVLCQTHLALKKVIRSGVSTKQLDEFAHDFMIYKKSIPAQLNYEGFPFSLCTSVNDEICHGFPSNYKLKDGDIISIDNVVNLNGGLADSCWSYAVGELSDENQKLMEVTLESLKRGIKEAKSGNRIGDIGNAIESYVTSNGFSVVRDFVGHGIGDQMHEDPQVPHYGKAHRGQRLENMMVITIEPMINIGDWKCTIDENGWTARTKDHSMSCQFEHQIVIRDDEAEILTDQSKYFLTEEDEKRIEIYKNKNNL